MGWMVFTWQFWKFYIGDISNQVLQIYHMNRVLYQDTARE